MIRVRTIHPSHVATCAFLRPLIERACSRGGGVDPDYVLSEAAKGGDTGRTVCIWLVSDGDVPVGVIITRLEQWVSEKVCRLLAAGGRDGPKWYPVARDVIFSHARLEGAARIVAEGRKGWGRLFGVKPARYVYECEVPDGRPAR